ELRDPGQTKGVRDALEHGNTQVVVSGSFESRALDIRMRGIRSKDPNGVDLHALIEPAIADFCSFLIRRVTLSSKIVAPSREGLLQCAGVPVQHDALRLNAAVQ